MSHMFSNRTLVPLIATGMLLMAAAIPEKPMAGDGTNPGEEFKIVVKWDGNDISGVDRASGLRRRTEVVANRAGGDPSALHKSPGVTDYDPIVLERPWWPDSEFEQWANKTWNFGSGLGTEVSLKDFRKDIIIEFYNEDGDLTVRFLVYRCWPSGYEAMGDYGFGDPSARERLTLEHEGWERDYSVVFP